MRLPLRDQLKEMQIQSGRSIRLPIVYMRVCKYTKPGLDDSDVEEMEVDDQTKWNWLHTITDQIVYPRYTAYLWRIANEDVQCMMQSYSEMFTILIMHQPPTMNNRMTK